MSPEQRHSGVDSVESNCDPPASGFRDTVLALQQVCTRYSSYSAMPSQWLGNATLPLHRNSQPSSLRNWRRFFLPSRRMQAGQMEGLISLESAGTQLHSLAHAAHA